jgi:hypothetical protein
MKRSLCYDVDDSFRVVPLLPNMAIPGYEFYAASMTRAELWREYSRPYGTSRKVHGGERRGR